MRSITTSIGSFNTLKTYADFTGPANKSKTLLYRLNLGYETTDTFRDLQNSKNIIIAPSFSYLPTDKTRLNVDIYYQNTNGKLDRAQSVFGEGDLYSTPISQSLSAANDLLLRWYISFRIILLLILYICTPHMMKICKSIDKQIHMLIRLMAQWIILK